MRKRARTDRIQQDVIRAVRDFGASVWPTHQLGDGFPDLVVGYHGLNLLWELKNGEAPPSEQKLTSDEIVFQASWRGDYTVIRSVEEAISELQKVASGLQRKKVRLQGAPVL